MTPFIGEIIGTMILIIFGGGVVAGVVLNHSKAQAGGWIVITAGWGMAVALAIYAVGDISGAHINPAVTVGLAAIGAFPWEGVPAYIIAQMIGAFIGACVVFLAYYPHWAATDDPGAKLAVFSTDPAIPHTPGNLLSEIIGTFILVLAILFVGANEFTEGLNPLIIGLLIFAIGLSLGGPTGYAINPARDLGPRVAHFVLPIAGKGDSNWQYAWIPVVGPVIGGVGGGLFYAFVFEAGNPVAMLIALAVLVACVLVAFTGLQQAPATSARATVDERDPGH